MRRLWQHLATLSAWPSQVSRLGHVETAAVICVGVVMCGMGARRSEIPVLGALLVCQVLIVLA